MAHKELKQKAINLRKKGKSYSQIKKELGVSKSTLSGWLHDMPLSEKRIRELQADSPIRIEHYRNTMRKKREAKFLMVYKEMKKSIGKITNRELFLSGLFLYWAEGTKSGSALLALTNTNPSMLKVYIRWLALFGVPRSKLRIHLHLYTDMNIKRQIKFWSKELDIPVSQFTKPYIKKSSLTSITYKNGFGQGTCSVIHTDTAFKRKVLMGIKYIQTIYS